VQAANAVTNHSRRNLIAAMELLEKRVLLSAIPVVTSASSATTTTKSQPTVLAIIESTLPDQQLLLQSIPNARVIYFNPNTESATTVLQQATAAAMAAGGDISTVMIFSHGASGEFVLGDDLITSGDLGATAAGWEALGQEIAPGGAIDLFACDLAAGQSGINLINQIHSLSGAGVFASTNITGEGGDWILEASSTGAQSGQPPINTTLLAEYPADLGLVTIETPAAANPSTVTGKTTNLSVLANDTSGESHVTYSWAATVSPVGSDPTFSINDSNAAKNTTVTFNEAGDYTFTVTASDGLSFDISAVEVTVDQTLSSVTVSPASAAMNLNQDQLFTATGYDQFGNEITVGPTFTWSIDSGGVGSIDQLGAYSSGATPGTATVRATDGAISGTSAVTVTDPAPTVVDPATATPNPVTTTTTAALSVLATDIGGTGNLTYTWAATAEPAGADPMFSLNGSALSDASTVTFDEAGDYTLTVTISDGISSTTSSVNVTVEQTLTSVSVAPASVDLAPDGTQQFTATALDQFGNPMTSQPTFTWSLAPTSDGSISSTGLYTAPDSTGTATILATADTIYIGTASATVDDTPPTVVDPASATPNPVTTTTTALSVLATDVGGTGNLTYTWAATAAPTDADPTFSLNGSALSDATTVTFNEAGDYTFTVTISDGIESTTSSVNVTVEQTLTSVSVSPASVGLAPDGTQQFTATALDQFGNAMVSQPAITWSLAPASDGSISSTGLYTAPDSTGNATVLATADTIYIGTASVTVDDTPPTIVDPAAATPNPVTTTTTTALSVLATDLGGTGNLTYTWAATAAPSGADPTYSLNGSALSDLTTVTFNEAGDYTFTVTVSDGIDSTTSSVNVTVEQTLTSVSVTPASTTLSPDGTQQFTATALDQFGNAMTSQPTITWSLAPASDGTISSTGLYTAPDSSGSATVLATADTIYIGTATVTVDDSAPTIVDPATATPNPVTTTTTVLSVLATDLGGTGNLTYTWAATAAPTGATPNFSQNGSATSTITTVTFNEAGDYTFMVTVSDGIDSSTSSVNVTVEQTLTSVSVTPASVDLAPDATQQFTATALDQFGNAMVSQPAITWSLAPASDGSISSTGLYTAPDSTGSATILATADTIYIGTASATIDDTPPTVVDPATATPNPVTSTTTVLSVLATDLGGTGNLTYSWAATAAPTGATPNFSQNDSATSTITTVTFNEAGDYTFTVTISDGIESTTSSVNVTVEQTLTSVSVTPASVDLAPNGTQQFTATALDQFGNAMDSQPTITWSLAPTSDGSISSTGLYTAPDSTGNATILATADTIYIGTASATIDDTPPTIVDPATATPNPVTTTTTLLSVLATDVGGTGNLTYTWAATAAPNGASPSFSLNDSATSAITTVTFNEAGDYTFTVTISDGIESTTSSVNVTVEQTLTSVSVTPASVDLAPDATQQFTATALDQFGNPMVSQPTITWSLAPASDGSISSTGLYTAPDSSGNATILATADTIYIGTASATVDDTPPTVVDPASATPNPVTGTTTLLSVLATDVGGTGNLTYTWAATAAPSGASPSFSLNDSATSAITTVTFNEAGDYTFTVTISDGIESTTSSVNVTVEQTLTSVSVTPASVDLAPNGTQQFSATALDQFGNSMASQPAFTWSLLPTSAGSISSTGLYTAPDSTGNATILATADTIYIGTASATVDDTPPTIVDPASATPNPVTGTTTLLSVLATDVGGTGNLTYTWAATAAPTGASPSFSLNDSATSAITTVTFNQAGDYTFTVTVSDGIESTTSSVNVTVEQTLTSVSVAPASVGLAPDGTQQFTATALDQFGNAMTSQPAFTWSLAPTSAGSISSTGLYTAPDSTGSATILATADTIFTGTATATVDDTPPTVVDPATATPNPVTGTTTALSVLATDIGGTGNLTYTWAATAAPNGADPTYSLNGSALSNATTVTFNEAGDYTFTVTISDGIEHTTSSVNVTVDQTLSSVAVTPASVGLAPNGTQQFAATALDQFGNPMSSQPAFTWSLDPLSVGSIDSSGLYTAPDGQGHATVRATTQTIFSGVASVTVNDTPPTIVEPATATPNPVTGTTTVLSVVATDVGGAGNLTFTWVATTAPTGADPIFSVNGSGTSAVTTVTFNRAGDYVFTVTISDGTASTTSSVNVTVDQTLSGVSVAPASVTLGTNATQQFTASAYDQFGNAMATQPSITWTLDPLSVGSVNSSGLYTSPDSAGSATVRASASALVSGTATVTVQGSTPNPIPPPPPIPVPTPPLPTPPVPIPTPSPTPVSTPTPTPASTVVISAPAQAVAAADSPLPPPPDLGLGAGAPATGAAVVSAAAPTAPAAPVITAAPPGAVNVATRILASLTSGLTSGLVAQLLIPGSLMASVFASLPAWNWVDPVSILSPNARKKMRGGNNAAAQPDKSKLGDLLQ
jgi:hypothetical protein